MQVRVVPAIIYAEVVQANGQATQMSRPKVPMVMLISDTDLSRITPAQWYVAVEQLLLHQTEAPNE
jgi:hypothetical protein